MPNVNEWNRYNQMPPGREFEVYHFTDKQLQPVYYHNHQHYEIYFFIRGQSRVVVEGLDTMLSKGDALIYPPGIMHRNIHLDNTIPYERFYFCVRREFLQSMSVAYYDLPSMLDKMTQGGRYYFHVNEEDLQELIRMTDEVIAASRNPGLAEHFINRSRFCILLVRALTIMSSQEPEPQSENGQSMSELIRYINRNITSDLPLDLLAAEFHFSKYHLARKFKAYTGISIHRYLSLRRILAAQEMIRRGIKPKDACFRCGFTDYSSFYRAFKTQVGMSPERFRKDGNQ